MKDRELLELAAKASGEISEHWAGNQAYFDGVLSRWNPLIDDGDALRVAVELNINIYIQIGKTWVSATTYVEVVCSEDHDNDSYAATRRAIVKAAAEIAKARGYV